MEDKKDLVISEDKNTGLNLFDTNPDNVAQNMITVATKTDIMTPEDKKFFIENSERWQAVATNTHIWRTTKEKESILFDHPTNHSKFHQCLLENKVFLDETVRLAKESEIIKLEAEALYIDIEDIKQDIEELKESLVDYSEDSREYRKLKTEISRKDIELRKKTVELQEKTYGVQNSAIAMGYRVAELKDWKDFEDKLLNDLRAEGYTDEQIWDKNYGQSEGFFFLFLNKYEGVSQSTDSGEVHNLTSLARFAVEEAIKTGRINDYLSRCSITHIKSLETLGYIKVNVVDGKIKSIDLLYSAN